MSFRLIPLLRPRNLRTFPCASVSTSTPQKQHEFSSVYAPTKYNFVRDQIEALAAKEQKTGKLLAYWWFDNIGNQLKLSYSDLADQSKM